MLLYSEHYVYNGVLECSRNVIVLFDFIRCWGIYHLCLLLQVQVWSNPPLMDDNYCNNCGTDTFEFSYTYEGYQLKNI